MVDVRMLQWFILWGWPQALCFEKERDSGCAGEIAAAMYRNISSTCELGVTGCSRVYAHASQASFSLHPSTHLEARNPNVISVVKTERIA